MQFNIIDYGCLGNACQPVPMWNSSDIPPHNSSNISSTLGADVVVYNWEVLVLLPIMLFGIMGNILVCMAVSMEKRLQSVTNYFLLSLAITDLLVSIIVMPFSIVHQFFGKYRSPRTDWLWHFLIFPVLFCVLRGREVGGRVKKISFRSSVLVFLRGSRTWVESSLAQERYHVLSSTQKHYYMFSVYFQFIAG